MNRVCVRLQDDLLHGPLGVDRPLLLRHATLPGRLPGTHPRSPNLRRQQVVSLSKTAQSYNPFKGLFVLLKKLNKKGNKTPSVHVRCS